MNQLGFLANKGCKMYKLALCLLFQFMANVGFGSTSFNSDLEHRVGCVSNGLFSGRQIALSEMEYIFEEIRKTETTERRESDASDSSAESESSTSSVTSHQSIDSMDSVMDILFEEPDKKPEQIKSRKEFIQMLHSCEDKVDPRIMARAVIMISEKLFA